MKGIRLPDGEADPWPPPHGAYWREPVQGRLVWYCITPNGLYGGLANHDVIAHDDGTITVSPSIHVRLPRGNDPEQNWHGYLERGEWREC